MLKTFKTVKNLHKLLVSMCFLLVLPSKHSEKLIESFFPSKHSKISTNLQHFLTFGFTNFFHATDLVSFCYSVSSGAALACFLLKAVSCYDCVIVHNIVIVYPMLRFPWLKSQNSRKNA